jgi:hypothetical protein
VIRVPLASDHFRHPRTGINADETYRRPPA